MSIEKINPRATLIIAFIVVVGALRTYLSMDENMFGLSNFSPIGAMALFGSVYFKKWWKAFSFPILVLLVSDLILQRVVFKNQNGFLYGGWYYVYGAFVLMTVVGRFIRRVSFNNVILASLVIVAIHWLVTDFGVWYGSKTYSQDIAGYWQCLIMAIPFEGRFLAGTVIYCAILFGAFEWLQYKYPVLAAKNQTMVS